MKKLIALMLILLLSAGALAEGGVDEILIDTAQDMAQRLSGLCATESWSKFFTGNKDMLSLIDSWAGDWTAPENRQRAAAVFLPREVLQIALPLLLQGAGLSVNIAEYDYVMLRLSTMPASFINARYGEIENIGAASIATLTDVRLMESLNSGVALVLMDFGPDHPLVLVSAYIGADHAASVSASFVVNGDYAETVFALAENRDALPDQAGLSDNAVLLGVLKAALSAVEIYTY